MRAKRTFRACFLLGHIDENLRYPSNEDRAKFDRTDIDGFYEVAWPVICMKNRNLLKGCLGVVQTEVLDVNLDLRATFTSLLCLPIEVLFKGCLSVVQTEMLERELSFEIDFQELARAIRNGMDFVKSVGVPTVKLEREQNLPLNGLSTTGGGTFHPSSASVVAISDKREPLSDVKGSSGIGMLRQVTERSVSKCNFTYASGQGSTKDRSEETAGVKVEDIPTSSLRAESSVHGCKIRNPGTVSENTVIVKSEPV
ncbi:hypothetical protein BV898_06649 [Hypsibius exemplaris]|uniref:Uncharacterized protein n=1 Tax=Hypsibius exemplaris TaxID=2072580 RepID=A0A1W0WVQ2_HYPEX|nr:hypothetical protein BV898_06649 [Hypsibius exemplaris]